MRPASSSVALAFIVATLAPAVAFAEWPTLGRAISVAIKNQERPKVATDGAGGAVIVWQDFRSPRVNIFARRVLASGELDPRWPIDGRALLTDSIAAETALEGQSFPVIVSDGSGGAIVAWQDGRFPSGPDIFAQHILGSGVVDPAWPANGRALSTARGSQEVPAIVSDGAGGAIVTWMDARSSITNLDIYAQHVLASGAVDPRWVIDGVPLSTALTPQAFPNIASDGSGGAIVTWFDFRPSATGIDIYAQHVTNQGVADPAWPANGRALSLAPGSQLNPTIISDGAHGAIVAWEDGRQGPSHIFAVRVLDTGAIATGWPVNGLAICTAPDEQVHPILTTDGANGALVAWQDARPGANHRPFAQHVLGSGAVDAAWPVNGRALSLSSGEAVDASITTDGSGGAIVAWEEDSFIIAQHILSSGSLDPAFPVNGRFVRLLLTFQHHPDVVRSGAGDAIVVWADNETSADSDIYANLVTTAPTVSVDPGERDAAIAFERPAPNPTRGSVTLSFTLPRATRVRLAVYGVDGRRVRDLMSGTQPAGSHAVTWGLEDERGRAVPAGLFFARLEVEGRALTQTITTLK